MPASMSATYRWASSRVLAQGPLTVALAAGRRTARGCGLGVGSFAVPDDPPRSGESDIHTPGPVRLLLELTVFFGAVAALNFAGLRRAARQLLVIMVGYQVLAYGRIGCLLSH